MLREQIQQDMIASLKGKKETELKVLRFVFSQIKYVEIDKHAELNDEEIVSVIKKEVKKRKEAIEMFKKGNRQDLVADEEAQLPILEKYLPKQMDEAELAKIIDETLKQTGSTASIGQIIGQVMAKVKGQADGAMAARLVKARLS